MTSSDEEITSTSKPRLTQVQSPGAKARRAKFQTHRAERRYSAVSKPPNGSKSDDLDGPLLRHPPSRYPPITPTTPALVAFLYNTWNQEDWVRAGYKTTPNTAPAVRCETERRGAVAAPPPQTRCTSQETPVIPADQEFKCQEGDTEDSSPEPSDATLLAQVADNVAHSPDWGNNNRSYQTDPALVTELEEMYDDELRRRGIVTYPNTQDDILHCRQLYNTVCRRMAERVHALYKRGEATAHQIAFVVETSTPDSDGTPNFRLQQAVATTEITTSSDCHNITLEPSFGVTSHGNYRELFIGSSAEHPVDLTQEYESEKERNEIFMIGFPDGQSTQRRIQRPAFARHTESPSTTAIDLSGSEDHDVPLLEWTDEDQDSFPAPIVAALLHVDFEAIVDSGSTRTIITGEARSLLRGPLQPHDQIVATAATGGQLQITGRGHVTPTYEMYYASHLRRSVMSVYELCEQGYEVAMTAHGRLIRRPDGFSFFRTSRTWLPERKHMQRPPHITITLNLHCMSGPLSTS